MGKALRRLLTLFDKYNCLCNWGMALLILEWRTTTQYLFFFVDLRIITAKENVTIVSFITVHITQCKKVKKKKKTFAIIVALLLTGCSVLIRDSALSSRYVTCIPHYRSALGTQVTLSTIHNTLSVDYLWFVSFKSHKTGLVVICSFMLRSLSYFLKLPPTLDNRKCRFLNERSLLFR